MGMHRGQLWLHEYRSQHALTSLTQHQQAARKHEDCLQKPFSLLIINIHVRSCVVGGMMIPPPGGQKDGHCLHRFALNPELPCSLHPVHPICLHHSVQLRPPHYCVRCPHRCDGLTSTWDSMSLARSSASVNWLCQLNSWPLCQPAFTSITPNMLQGQGEPLRTSLRSSWLNPNLGEM